MKKLKLKTFSNLTKKPNVCVWYGDQVRWWWELLGRFLIIQGSRPALVSKLEEAICEYGNICGECRLVHLAIEQAKAPTLQSAPSPDLANHLHYWCHGCASANAEITYNENISDLWNAFIKRIEWMLGGFHEGGSSGVNRHQDQSLKDQTRN